MFLPKLAANFPNLPEIKRYLVFYVVPVSAPIGHDSFRATGLTNVIHEIGPSKQKVPLGVVWTLSRTSSLNPTQKLFSE